MSIDIAKLDALTPEHRKELVRKLKLPSTDDVIWSVLLASTGQQDRLRRDGVIDDAFYALAKHNRSRGVPSSRSYGTWRVEFQRLLRIVRGRIAKQRGAR